MAETEGATRRGNEHAGNEGQKKADGAGKLMRRVLGLLVYLAAATAVSVFLRFRTPGIPGFDTYYHFRHADLYVRYGLWMKEFPWLVYSTISRFAGDIGYGFHVFLIPFALLPDEVMAMKLGAAVETAIVLVVLYLVLRRHRVPYACAWPFYLLFLAPPITYTFLLTRPQILTMGFVAVLLSFMVRGRALGVLLASFALAFLHFNAFPLVLVVVAVTGAVTGIVESRWEWRKWVASVGGIGLAWVLRPNPLGVAQLEYNQILVHETARHAQLPLLFGREWAPVAPSALGVFALPILLWAVASVALVGAAASPRSRASGEERSFLWSGIALSALFFVLMVVVTRRFTPFWATSAVIVTATAFALLLRSTPDDEHQRARGWARAGATVGMAVVLGVLGWGALKPYATHVSWSRPTDRALETIAKELRDNGVAGEIVYNVDWAMFPELFFSNTEDYYVSGLDPIFLYAYDPELYWQFHHVATGAAVESTYRDEKRSPGSAVPTHTFMHAGLRASYVLLNHQRYGRLNAYLQGDPRFSLVLAEQDLALYAVLDAAATQEVTGAEGAAGQGG